MMPMYINGQWVEASDGASVEVYDPATEQVIDSVPNGTPDDALKAITAAKAAFDVPVIAFTGSTAVGQHISRLAADRIKRLHLELGGKDPFVVAPDADIETAVEAVAYAALINAGQACTSSERIYVPDEKLNAFASAVADYVKGLWIGPGLEPTTDMGPIAAPGYQAKVEEHVAEAEAKGAKILAGGGRPP